MYLDKEFEIVILIGDETDASSTGSGDEADVYGGATGPSSLSGIASLDMDSDEDTRLT
jgi:hypothetical protein